MSGVHFPLSTEGMRTDLLSVRLVCQRLNPLYLPKVM